MKILGIGDLFIPPAYIEKALQKVASETIETEVIEWKTADFTELQNINLLIEQHGCEAYQVPEYILEKAANADVVITQFCPVNRAFIDRCPNLKVIGVLRGGYENVHVAYATEKGIMVCNTPGRNADSVADFTVGGLISECRNIARGHAGLKNGEWIREYPNSAYIPDLPGKTVGIIGLGEIGRKVAKRLSGFDMEILGYDPYVSHCDHVELVELDELLKRSDFVSIHARLTPDTAHLINADNLKFMKPTAYLINTSRAGLIDEQALYQVLKEKKIAGAMLDVFEQEPPGKDYPLVALPNVTVTPHMAGGSKDAFYLSPVKLVEELKKLFGGEKTRFLVNPECFSVIG